MKNWCQGCGASRADAASDRQHLSVQRRGGLTLCAFCARYNTDPAEWWGIDPEREKRAMKMPDLTGITFENSSVWPWKFAKETPQSKLKESKARRHAAADRMNKRTKKWWQFWK